MEAAVAHEVEEWRPIAGFPKYEVSSAGRVRSPRCILKPTPTASGHLNVGLWRNGERAMRLVHRLALEAFSGPPGRGQECRHLDGNPGNNHQDNLRWGTRKENGEDKVMHGKSLRGRRHPNAKLTKEAVHEIRSASGYGWNTALAEKFGVSRTLVSAVRHGRAWAWC